MADMVAGNMGLWIIMNIWYVTIVLYTIIVMGIVDYYHPWELLHEASWVGRLE